MRGVRRSGVLISVAMCVAVPGCGSGVDLAASEACRDLREASAGYQGETIPTIRYLGLLEAAAREAQDADDRDLVEAAKHLESAASSSRGGVASLGDLATVPRAASRMSDICDGLLT